MQVYCKKKSELKLGDIAEFVAYKHAGQSLVPRAHIFQLCTVVHTCNLSARTEGTGGYPDLIGQLA